MPRIDAAVQVDGNETWNGAFMIDNYDSVDVFIDVDVGKGEHCSRPGPGGEGALR